MTDPNMELLIDLFDRYSDEEIASQTDLSYDGRDMTREQTLLIVSTIRAARIAKGFLNGGRSRMDKPGET